MPQLLAYGDPLILLYLINPQLTPVPYVKLVQRDMSSHVSYQVMAYSGDQVCPPDHPLIDPNQASYTNKEVFCANA